MDVEGDDNRLVKDGDNLAQFKANVPSLSWSDYQFKILPFDARDTNDTKRIKRERRRWRLADKDGNDRLTKQEFKVFSKLKLIQSR